MNLNLLLLALALAAPAFAAGEAPADGDKAAAQREDAARLAMMRYWEAQPEAEAAAPGLLGELKALPWPDPRPVPADRYLKLPGKAEGEAARKESDEGRYDLWMENFGFYMRAINNCESGRTAGAARVEMLEAMQAFIKEGEPRFYTRETTDKAAFTLQGLGERAALLTADLSSRGQYLPDARSLAWAEQIEEKLRGGSSATDSEKAVYYKIVKRVREFDPRAGRAAGAAEGKAGAPGPARDEKWEGFLQGLAPRCSAAVDGLPRDDLRADYKASAAKEEAALKEILASFPAGWEKYPRAKWAYEWFFSGLQRAVKQPNAAGRAAEMFKVLDNYEAGLKAAR